MSSELIIDQLKVLLTNRGHVSSEFSFKVFPSNRVVISRNSVILHFMDCSKFADADIKQRSGDWNKFKTATINSISRIVKKYNDQVQKDGQATKTQ